MLGQDENQIRKSVGGGKSIFILTSHYPYPEGEQFLETEIPVWRQHFDGRIVLMPASADGKPRCLPEGVDLCHALSDSYQSVIVRARAIVLSFFFLMFWKEIGFLRQKGKLSARTAFHALKAVTHVLVAKTALRWAIRNYGHPDIVYTYWFSYHAFAAGMLSSKTVVVTRAHGGDLYEDRSPDLHMYLKRQFLHRIDRIYVISQDGIRYMRDFFRVEKNVELSRLGVEIPSYMSNSSAHRCISILSISFCVSIKNIDRIMDAVCIAAAKMNDVKISWRHIGDGPLRSVLEARAENLFAGTPIDWRFLGQMENSAVLHYLETHPVDFILNASSSEGIPVSIMEAMARGVPAIAPNVGGISELVCDDNGVLLAADVSGEEIATAIIDGIDRLKSLIVRRNAAETIKNNFDRDTNYRLFIQNIVELSDSRCR
ncbi:glycosyltransferase [Aquamicrobium sp.]|uniref:glycosyltransferase n=1 Tax=Aquamicrobium sp. TaxID=1872579 RepID=UPI00258DF851|nr:glycosyltransferase [Aquamicrobium sp.]MCK9549672.1 glycosyltransferase [Aquamicrobium sp.]